VIVVVVCSACEDGYYGPSCVKLCECVSAQGPCDKVTGACRCNPGYWGPRCDRGKCVSRSAGKL